VRSTEKEVTESDTAYVQFKELTDDEIWHYINKYNRSTRQEPTEYKNGSDTSASPASEVHTSP
jgi:hypothetical protein